MSYLDKLSEKKISKIMNDLEESFEREEFDALEDAIVRAAEELDIDLTPQVRREIESELNFKMIEMVPYEPARFRDTQESAYYAMV